MFKVIASLITLTSLFIAPHVFAESHDYVTTHRSSYKNRVFFQQSIEGEFGSFSTSGSKTNDFGGTDSYVESQDWKGYNFGTTVGMEVLKFVQFNIGHSFINMQSKDDRNESLIGSRVKAGMKIVFSAPIFNLELGAGFQGSRLDYQKQLENGMFHGSGMYQEVSFNHYMNSQISLYLNAGYADEQLTRTAGSSAVKDMKTSTTVMGAGIRIWL